MSVAISVDPRLSALLGALGLVDGDGSVQPDWFSHPLESISHCLENDSQRAALFQLLEQALPAAPGSPGWHPVVEANRYGNVYVTVEGDTIGVAAAVGTVWTDLPTVRATVELPLLTAANGQVRATVGPLEVAVVVELAPQASPASVGLRVEVGIDGSVHVVVRIEDGATSPHTVTEFDPTTMDARTIHAIQALVQSILEHETSVDPMVQRLVAHLPGVLGLGDPVLSPFPLTDPAGIRSWFTTIAASPAMRQAWFTHLVGAMGAHPAAPAPPAVLGTGDVDNPLRATMLSIGGVDLELRLAAAGSQTEPALHLGVGVAAALDPLAVVGHATIAAVPLGGTGPVQILPAAGAEVTVAVTSGLVTGHVDAGVQWDGNRLMPMVRLRNVAGLSQTVDLTDANSVVTAAVGAVLDALKGALGLGDNGARVLTLVGLAAPSGDPDSRHHLGADALSGNFLRAVAEVHRSILGDPVHSWKFVLADLAGLLGLTADVGGAGTRDEPWHVELAGETLGDVPFAVQLAAWDDRRADTPDGVHQLRLGLRAVAGPGTWIASWSTELLGFDLAPGAATAIRLIGAQHLAVALVDLPELDDVAGIGVAVDQVRADLSWLPGSPAQVSVTIRGLRVTAGADRAGPLTVVLPGTPDPRLPDLGLGLDPAELVSLVRLLLARAWSLWGDDQTAHALAGLFGLHDRLSGLPDDWPALLTPQTPDLMQLFSSPLYALGRYARAVLTGTSRDDTPFAVTALEWVAALVAGRVPDDPDDRPPLALQIGGAGTYDRPWRLPIGDGGPEELLVWLDDGPGRGVPPDLELATDGASLLVALAAAAETHDELFEVYELLRGRDPARTGLALNELATWLASGDGLVPYDSQVAVPTPLWAVSGLPLAVTPDAVLTDRSAIDQTRNQLAAWQAPALVLATATTGPVNALLARIEPGHDPDARFDLRGRPLADLGTVTAHAAVYPVHLDHGDLDHLVAQIARTVARVSAITGAPKVALVGAGPAGVAARVAAARTPAAIAGVVTIAAPHGGSPLDPLTRADLAEATRVADHLAPGPGTALLLSILDGGPARDGVLPPAGAYGPAAFGGVPAGTVDAVPGLAIGSRLPDTLISALLAAGVARCQQVTRPTSHVGVGASLALDTPDPGNGVRVESRLRVDLLRVRIDDGPEPVRSPCRVRLSTVLSRDAGWLVGGAGPDATTRVRWAEVEVGLDRDGAGALVAVPVVRLHEAGPAGTSAAVLDLPAVLDALATHPPVVGLPSDFQGPGADLVRACLSALGLTDATGGLVVANLRTLAATPLAWLGPRLNSLLGVLAPAVGATAGGNGWRLPVLGGLQVLTLIPDPWTLRLVTDVAGSGAGTLPGVFGGLTVDAALAFPAMRGSASAALDIGALRLDWSAGALRLGMPPWLPPIRIAPDPDPDAGARLAAALPRGLLSAVLGLLAQPVLGNARALPVDLLFAAPGEFFRTVLGDGEVLQATRINALLDAVSTVLGRQPTGALELPGGLRLHAVDPFALRLSGSISIEGATLALDLGLGLSADLVPSPSGTLGLTVPLPDGNWHGFGVTIGLAGTAVSLSVQPSIDTPAIEILPHFNGLGALTAGAGAVLPHALQALVEELSPPGAVLDAVLDIATDLGIYGRDPQGFNEQGRAAKLATMLQPDWWSSMADPSTLMSRIAGLFAPGRLPLPYGSVASSGGTVRWTVPLTTPLTGSITVGLGWSASNEPVLTLTATSVVLGPVVLDQATVGFDGDVVVEILAHLRMDQGLLAPLTPALEIGVASGRFTSSVLPLGVGTKAEFELVLAPSVAVHATDQAAIDIVLRWGLPLALNVILAALSDVEPGTVSPLERHFWAGGPSARTILDGAGLVPLAGPPVVTTVPAPLAMILGAVQAAATGLAVDLTNTLHLSLVHETGGAERTGVRLYGMQEIESDDVTVRIVLGKATWLTDPDAGITVWLIERDPTPGALVPLRLAPALSAVGLGVMLDGDPLVDGSLQIGAAGGLVFLAASFLDAHRNATVSLDHLGAALAVERAFVNLSGGDADSFLAKVLPPELKAPFDLAVIYRDGTLSFGGTSPLSTGHIEFVIPLNLDLTVIKITELLLGLRIATGQFSIEAALSGGADVGPIVAAVKRVGLIAAFGQGGSGLRFRPPDMVGLAIDASTIRLGGFLLIDAERGRYVGAIEIALLGKLELTAIGIITTKMPDGSPGFSLLFIISMILPVPISLSYGFFFGGAGGLLGLNRGTNLDALRNGLRTGTAESILFPKDVVRRADAIVRDIEAVFPIAQGQFVVGPMVLITWMNPAIVTVKLGIILELGTPIRIGILGLLQLALPDPDEAILNLKCAFLGTVDFAGGLLSFDAAIYDSGIGLDDVKLSIEGDIALRLSWGAKPDFVTSVGGFHPAFHPDAHLKLPEMRRLSISLLKDNPHIMLATYFAITANSVQIGALLDFGFEVSGFSITGQFGFDVLLQFSPFLFDAAIYARLLVKADGKVVLQLAMDFTLHGPTPWIARGTATFSILFFTVKVAFEKVFGGEVDSSIPDIAVLPALLAELARAENWAAQVPAGTVSVVALLPVEPVEGSVVIEPSGVVSVTQRIVPLGTNISRFGAYRPNDVSRIDPVALRLAGTAIGTEPVTELFSPGAFQALPDDDKLRAPAFVQLPAGRRAVDPSTLHTDYALGRLSHYDLIEDDPQAAPADRETRKPAPTEALDRFRAQVAGGVVGHSSAARLVAEQAERGAVLAVGPAADRYGVARTDDLRPVDSTGGVAPVSTDARHRPVLPAGVLLVRPDAEARAQALRQSTGHDYRVVPESQLVVVV